MTSITVSEAMLPEISTMRDGPKYCPFMTESAIRWKIFSDENFKQRCSKKVGRRRYILPREIINFIKEQTA